MRAKQDFIFVDESGDAGYTLDPATGILLSTGYYVQAALHLSDNAFPSINEHLAAFRYLTGQKKELKLPAGKPIYTKFMAPIQAIAEASENICASVVYLKKDTYAGNYLKPGGKRPQDSTRFRNYGLRRLLEFHFKHNSLKSQHYDLVLDRIEMTKEEKDNLQQYLARNWNIPTPTNITHVSSLYVEAMQVVHHIANGFKKVVLGAEPPEELAFVNVWDMTTDQPIQ